MKEIKIGDRVKVTRPENESEDQDELTWLETGHQEGNFKVLEVMKENYLILEDGDVGLFYYSAWCELVESKIDLTKPQLKKAQELIDYIRCKNNWKRPNAQENIICLALELRDTIESPPKPKTRLMTRREILAKVATMDKDNPFLVGDFRSKKEALNGVFSDWELPQWWSYNSNNINMVYKRHIHPKTGEWTSEPMQFLIKEGKE